MATSYSHKFQRKMMREFAGAYSTLFMLALYGFFMWQLFTAHGWDEKTFWLLALVGVSLERKAVAIYDRLNEIGWRR